MRKKLEETGVVPSSLALNPGRLVIRPSTCRGGLAEALAAARVEALSRPHEAYSRGPHGPAPSDCDGDRVCECMSVKWQADILWRDKIKETFLKAVVVVFTSSVPRLLTPTCGCGAWAVDVGLTPIMQHPSMVEALLKICFVMCKLRDVKILSCFGCVIFKVKICILLSHNVKLLLMCMEEQIDRKSVV